MPVFLPQTDETPVAAEVGPSVPESPLQVIAEPAIAVLPFLNLTGDPAKEYFAAGFTEDVTIELMRYEDFHVFGYRAVTGAADLNKQSLRDLGTRFLVEGSLQMSGQVLRLGVMLTDAKDGKLLWGEQYHCDVDAGRLFELQATVSREIAVRIAGECAAVPTRISLETKGKAPHQLSTYEVMLRCYYFHRVLSREAFLDAFASLQSSIEREPDFPMSLAMLADLYLTSYSLDIPGIDEPLEHRTGLIERAVALDPNNQYIQHTLAHLHFSRNDRD